MIIMFDIEEVKKILELHNKSYRLFLWISNKLKGFKKKSKKHTLFNEVHGNISFYSGCIAWIKKHYNEIPIETRPEKSNLESFTHMLTSYLKTSFIFSNEIKVYNGCHCPFLWSYD